MRLLIAVLIREEEGEVKIDWQSSVSRSTLFYIRNFELAVGADMYATHPMYLGCMLSLPSIALLTWLLSRGPFRTTGFRECMSVAVPRGSQCGLDHQHSRYTARDLLVRMRARILVTPQDRRAHSNIYGVVNGHRESM